MRSIFDVFTVTVVLGSGVDKSVYRNVPYQDALAMIEGRKNFHLIFGDKDPKELDKRYK